jgi:hypothetical protein
VIFKTSTKVFLLLFEGTFTSFFKDKVAKQLESMFFLPFLLDNRRIRIWIHISDQWIRILEAQKHMDSTDPDPLLWTNEKAFRSASQSSVTHPIWQKFQETFFVISVSACVSLFSNFNQESVTDLALGHQNLPFSHM